jgi:hypothetical protein
MVHVDQIYLGMDTLNRLSSARKMGLTIQFESQIELGAIYLTIRARETWEAVV